MLISYNWLQEYIDESLPKPKQVADVITHGAYEVEKITKTGDDFLFDIDILPNRASDSLSHQGVAREFAVLSDNTFIPIDPDPTITKGSKTEESITLSIETPNCRRGLKRLAVDVSVAPSPDWLKNKLEKLGQKSINNVVDITNYVMLATGQPVHAFDFDKIAGQSPKSVFIRQAEPGEMIKTLDGGEHELTEDVLVIADKEKSLDIAGIKGGQNSQIDEQTSKVLLSVCSFDPATIRHSSKQLNLRTDASKRFENNVPPQGSPPALELFSELLAEICDASVSSELIDVYKKPRNPYKVGVTVENVNDLLGTDISKQEIAGTLEKIGCQIEEVNPRELVLAKAQNITGAEYQYGASISFDAPETFDCSSYTAWLYIQAGIGLPRQSAGQYVYTQEINKNDLEPGDIVFSNTKQDEGGTIHYESEFFMPGTEIPDGVDHCGIYLGNGQIIHASRYNTPPSVTVEKLADSKSFRNITKYGRVPGVDQTRLVATTPYWRPDLRRTEDLIEEVGRVHGYDNIATDSVTAIEEAATDQVFLVSQSIKETLIKEGFSEVNTYSLTRQGEVELENPPAEDKAYLRSSLQVNIEDALEKNKQHLPLLKTNTLKIFEIGSVFTESEEYHEVALGVSGDQQNEVIIEAFRAIEAELDVDLNPKIKSGVGLALLSSDKISSASATVDYQQDDFSAIDFQPPSVFPFVLRDIAVWTPAGTRAELVQGIIEKNAGDLLENINLFDKYEQKEKISYAFKLVFQSREKTLSDQQVNKQMNKIEDALGRHEGFKVR